jgi:hypothetical protein
MLKATSQDLPAGIAARQAWLYTVCMVRGVSHQVTGVDETCNQEHLKKMVVPLLCKCFEQRNKRHLIKIPVSAKTKLATATVVSVWYLNSGGS